jgi:hypothetical protein
MWQLERVSEGVAAAKLAYDGIASCNANLVRQAVLKSQRCKIVSGTSYHFAALVVTRIALMFRAQVSI